MFAFFRFNKKDVFTILISWILSIIFVLGTNYFVNDVLSDYHSKRINILFR